MAQGVKLLEPHGGNLDPVQTTAPVVSPIRNLQVGGTPPARTIAGGTPLTSSVNPYPTAPLRKVDTTQIPGQGGAPGNTGVNGPSGGNFRDPNYASQFLSYWASQPGVNPSLQNDPNYWLQKITSGELGSDPNYIISKFKLPEGAPAGVNNSVSSSFGDPPPPPPPPAREQQMAMLQSQQQQQLQSNEQLKARQAAAMTSSDQLVGFLKQRADTLQQPGYTPSEQNILKTQATDPIEADRQAALKRALDNIGSRNLDPSSGIAQDLMRQVNQGFDQTRSGAQNDLAVKQITEQRSREQEAQQLMAMIPQAQMAAANGDLSFLQALNAAVSQLGAQAAVPAAQLYQLPQNAAQQALAAMGQAPNPADLTQQSIALAGLTNQKNTNSASFWASLGASFAPLFGA